MGNQELIIDYIKRYIRNKQDLNSAIIIKGKWGVWENIFCKENFRIRIKRIFKS